MVHSDSMATFAFSLEGVQPYRNASASWKTDLCRVNPSSAKGRTVSHVEAPFSMYGKCHGLL